MTERSNGDKAIMRKIMAAFAIIAAAVGSSLSGLGTATAAGTGTGHPVDWQIGLQGSASEVADGIHSFYNLTNAIIIGIAIFVLILLIVVLVRFREGANPTPSKTTHNSFLEVAWTAIPILILLIIAIPSFKLLFLQYSYPKPDLTIKATGSQWFWTHEYQDQGGFSFDSTMVRDEDLLTKEMGEDAFNKKYGELAGTALSKALYRDAAPLWKKYGLIRQLSTDLDVVVPVGKVVHVLVTAADVIHNWTVPSFGSKVDAVPGRVTATWFRADKKGVFYGQCSELCGKDHGNMPITVRVVDQKVFDAWAAAMKAEDQKKAAQILKQAALHDAREQKLAAVKTAR